MMHNFAPVEDLDAIVLDGRRSHEPGGTERWYRSPILWLGAALLAASIAGCIVTIFLAVQHPDTALPTGGEQLLKVPVTHTVVADRSSVEPD